LESHQVFWSERPRRSCGVGTAPVSYRLNEALQLGAIPLVLYDHRGKYIPYMGTPADVNNLGGWVLPFESLASWVDDVLVNLSYVEV
jgi:hypothetical protein